MNIDTTEPARPDLPKVGDWFRFEGLEGQNPRRRGLHMRVEYVLDWGEVLLSRFHSDGTRFAPTDSFERNERQIPLPTLLSMIEHGVLVSGKPEEKA